LALYQKLAPNYLLASYPFGVSAFGTKAISGMLQNRVRNRARIHSLGFADNQNSYFPNV